MKEFLLEPFSYEFVLRGLTAALLLGISGAMLGCVLMLRRLSLMSDALAHSMLPGIAIAYLIVGKNIAGLLLGALIAGLITAVGSGIISRLTRIKEDAAFGALFLVLFSLGVVIVSGFESRINLLHFLFGNILGVTSSDLWFAAGATALTLGAFIFGRRAILLETFDPVFNRATGGRGGLTHSALLALTVLNLVAALQAMGVVLSMGLFLLPAITAYLWCDRLVGMFFTAVCVSIFGSVVGIFASFHLGLPSSASIVLSLGALFLLSAIASPKYGVAAKLWRLCREGRGVVNAPD